MNEYILTPIAISSGALIFIYALYIRGRREQFRSDIRRMRDALFDLMWQNGYSFADPGYRATREMLNGLLRMSNTLSLSQLLFMMYLYFRWNLAGEAGQWNAKRSPNKQLDDKLEQIKKNAAARIVRFVFCEGFTGIAVLVLYCAFVLLRGTSSVKTWIVRQSRLLVQDAAMLSPSAIHHGT